MPINEYIFLFFMNDSPIPLPSGGTLKKLLADETRGVSLARCFIGEVFID